MTVQHDNRWIQDTGMNRSDGEFAQEQKNAGIMKCLACGEFDHLKMNMLNR